MATREEAIHVLALLSDGVPIVQSCKELGITRSKLYVAIDREGLGDMHARAREEYAEARVAEMQNIAETVEDVARAKLLCDNIKWEAARVAPKKYGDKVQNEHTGKDGGPIEQAVSISVTFHDPEKAGCRAVPAQAEPAIQAIPIQGASWWTRVRKILGSCACLAHPGRTETDARPMHPRGAELHPRIRPQAAVRSGRIARSVAFLRNTEDDNQRRERIAVYL